MNIMDMVKKTAKDIYGVEYSYTENGARGLKSSGWHLLDLMFSIPQLRAMDANSLAKKWICALGENFQLAMRWLFFLRDIRGGAGERATFRRILKYMAENYSAIVEALLDATVTVGDKEEALIPFYGRWDDILCLIGTPVEGKVFKLIKDQLDADIKAMENNLPCSLMAKWLPSIRSDGKESRRLSKAICKGMMMKHLVYRHTLSKLRSYLKVVEKDIVAKAWNDINFETVPSKAMSRYSKLFSKRASERFEAFKKSLIKGEAKVKAGAIFPHDIVHSTKCDPANRAVYQSQWENQPNVIDKDFQTIVVADGSGSMMTNINSSNVTALEVANALAIYMSERLCEPYKDKYITFSMKPQFVDLSTGKTLAEKLEIAERHDECANTNLEAVFNLILQTAIENKLKQEELPNNILVISDMEFDTCASGNTRYNSNWGNRKAISPTLMESIADKYSEHGYKLPRLIFWNVNSRTGTIPVTENELGVALVSGYSVHIAKMVMSGEVDPYKNLVDMLSSDRYEAVEKAISDVLQ